MRQDRHHHRPRLGRRSGRATSAAPTSSPGRRAAATRGRVSPFGGRAKLPWNLEWAAKWSRFGVTIEGCGKDLATAGGSRDRSDAIAREVFEREPPLNVPYEFLNIGGRKMSTSKGRGARAHEMAEVLPPELVRFLFLRHRPNHAHRLRPGGRHRSRASSTSSTGSPPRPPGARCAASCPPTPSGSSASPCSIPARTPRPRRPRFRPAVPPPRAARPGPRRGRRGAHGGREGRAARRAPSWRSCRARRQSARAWLETCAPEQARLAVAARPAAGRGRRRSPTSSGVYLGGLALAAERSAPASGEAWQDLDLPRRRGAAHAGRPRRSGRCTLPSWAGPTGRGPAGSWRACQRTSSSSGCARRQPRRPPARKAAAGGQP